KTPAERVLIARREKGARLVDRKGDPRGKTDLRDLVDENSVLGQFGADRFEKRDLRGDFFQALAPRRLPLLHLGFTRGALGVMRRQFLLKALQDRRGIAGQR